jgi:hypothetical protein
MDAFAQKSNGGLLVLPDAIGSALRVTGTGSRSLSALHIAG